MKPRGEVLNAIRHREVRPVPYIFGWEDDVGERLAKHYGDPEWHLRLLRQRFAWTGVVDTMRHTPIDGKPGWVKDLYGSVWRYDLRPFHLEVPGLAKPSFDGYEWPSPEKFFMTPENLAVAQKVVADHKDERFTIAGLGWGLLEHSWGIRGYENMLMDAAAEPEFFEELLDRLTAQFLAYVDFTCETLPDVDAIFFGDDWGDQRGVIVGPERWRQLFKPRWAKIYDRAHSHGKIAISHCCGSVADIMPDIIEIGLDVLESVQPEAHGMNPYELKRKYGDKITFWGCLGSQSTMSSGTPDQIAAEVRRLCREMGKGGGYILAPAKWFQPETSTAQAVAAIEAALNQEE